MKLCPVGFEAHASMHIQLQIGPNVEQAATFSSFELKYFVDQDHRPRGNANHRRHIFFHDFTGHGSNFFFPAIHERDLLAGGAHEFVECGEIFEKHRAHVSVAGVLIEMVKVMAATNREGFTSKQSTLFLASQIHSDHVLPRTVVAEIEGIAGDRNVFALVVCGARRLCKPRDFPRPDHVLLSFDASINPRVKLLVLAQGNQSAVVIHISDLMIMVGFAPSCIFAFGNQ